MSAGLLPLIQPLPKLGDAPDRLLFRVCRRDWKQWSSESGCAAGDEFSAVHDL
jgi:hypothetical protein